MANAKTYIKGDFAASWRKALHDGWVEGTAFDGEDGVGARPSAAVAAAGGAGGMEISFRPDPSLYDGRYANVGWLQELPKQVTNLSWDNAALMSMATMDESEAGGERRRLRSELNGRKVIAPALMVPGHPDGAMTVHLGFGRGVEAGRVGAGVGFNAYLLRTADAPLYAPARR